MTGFLPIDYGLPISGMSGLAAVGTTQATATTLPRQVNVFNSVQANGAAVLPNQYSPGSELRVYNRGGASLNIYPAFGDQIEAYGVNTAVALPDGDNAVFVSFDEPMAASPRTWWVDLRGTL